MVAAVRLVIEDQLPATVKGIFVPGFVRATAFVKMEEKGIRTKQLDNKIGTTYSQLAPEGSYANDIDILNEIVARNAFVHQKENWRLDEYVKPDVSSYNKYMNKKK